MHRVEALWLKIVAVLLMLPGLTLFASPRIPYTTKEEIGHTGLKVKREKTIAIPRPVAVLIIATGATALIFASRRPRD